MNEEKYLDNIQKISELLKENEMILRNNGYNPPINNYTVENDKRIKIPAGYIRKSDIFWEKYHLSDIIEIQSVGKNITYALQLSDYYNFIVNRFNIWGSIERMLYKQMFVNVIAVIEALILECANNVNSFCKKNCSKAKNCLNYINKNSRGNMRQAVEKLFEIGILSFSEEEKNRLIEFYILRNKIHIRLNKENEFLDNKFNCKLYNEAINMLHNVTECIYTNGIQYYNKCIGHREINQ